MEARPERGQMIVRLLRAALFAAVEGTSDLCSIQEYRSCQFTAASTRSRRAPRPPAPGRGDLARPVRPAIPGFAASVASSMSPKVSQGRPELIRAIGAASGRAWPRGLRHSSTSLRSGETYREHLSLETGPDHVGRAGWFRPRRPWLRGWKRRTEPGTSRQEVPESPLILAYRRTLRWIGNAPTWTQKPCKSGFRWLWAAIPSSHLWSRRSPVRIRSST